MPQLRGGPAPRQDAEQPVGHDPGLMAAFQRGIGLAEAQQSLEADGTEPAPHPVPGTPDPMAWSSPPGAPAPFLPHDTAGAAPHPTPGARGPAVPRDGFPGGGIAEARPAHAAAPAEAYGAHEGPDRHGPDQYTARHDGSAPAG